jgi:hypothetical protein
MSRKPRCTLAVLCLMAALLLILPAPSQAAGLFDWSPLPGLFAHAWSWLQNLGLLHESPTPVQEKQGSMGDPDGAKPPPAPPSATNSDQGSMGDPDG